MTPFEDYVIVSFMFTKIIATIGPSSSSPEVLTKLAASGMDIARMNFSHCTYEEFKQRKAILAKASQELHKEIKILQDLQGPRIRVGKLPEAGIHLIEGETVTFCTGKNCSEETIYIDDPYLHVDIKVGDPIYLASGEMELIAEKIEGNLIHAKIVRGGILYSRKGVNVPHTKLTTSGLTEKDIADVEFALNDGVDYVAISFPQSAKDVQKLQEIVQGRAKVISKIETAMALEHIDEIVRASDVIMVARGDLGIEISVEKLPFIQKNLVRHAAWHNKGAIIATQMLYSMVNHPTPTRAEVSDVANAVWDGADAVMLSDETASGQYPIEALQAMVRIVTQAEEYGSSRPSHF